ncbi:hypothetical protein SAMN05216499_109193 [Actinacidiphila paucisporea]|uniref:Uncharacterized protein n=1 Tax=Actinacidiphila paucisporea TaxID=310782 RepID=A0A1M7H8H8_9ACTN|nr:hypothetical protein SAMN05216499_109193 [Actinacidiphila paucisporea]
MPHVLTIAAIDAAAWTVLSVPLGILIGRRPRHASPGPRHYGPTAVRTPATPATIPDPTPHTHSVAEQEELPARLLGSTAR